MIPAEARTEVGGHTEIADRVPERIAARVATEADQTGGVARRLLGVRLGQAAATAAPRVVARVDGGLVTLQMRVSVAYPAPVRQVVRGLREQVTRRVVELTGLRVGNVDVEVTTLLTSVRKGAQ